jgi:hypothetical protein
MILLLGAALRLIASTWGLPYQLHPDEPVLFINAWERATAGTTSFMRDYPPIYIYLLTGQRMVIDALFGSDTPQVVYFYIARYTSVLTSVLLLATTYRVGKQALNAAAGLALVLFLALEPLVMLEQGFLIKGDNLAWLLTMVTLWFTLQAQEQRSWRWLVAAGTFGILATFTKYNMVLIFVPVFYVGWSLLVRQRVALMLLLPLLVVGGVVGGRAAIQATWRDQISPWMVENCRFSVDLADGEDNPIMCSGLLSFQKHAYPFYNYERSLWDDTTDATLEHVIYQLRDIFEDWRLLAGTILMVGLAYYQRRNPAVWMVLFTVVSLALLYALIGIPHPHRQYFPLMAAVALLLAMGIGQLPRWELAGAGILIVMGSFLLPALDFIGELQKPDTRALTADYMLANAPEGVAVIIEYDHVEFQAQYGGFPGRDGYFNILPVISVYEEDVDTLAQRGISYVVVDARGREGYYDLPDRWPDDMLLLQTYEGEEYAGPDRRIYYTERPDTLTDIRFGDAVQLHGYNLSVEDEALVLDLYFQARQANLIDYSVFIHLVDVTTGELAQPPADAPPALPTRFWKANQWIVDERNIPLSLEPGTYIIRMGFYDPQTGDRLPVADNPSGFIDLTEITISG